MSTPIEVSDSACVVCFKAIDIYSIGECDHPVCFECSTRMRVLCLQTECPICRQDLSKVIFTSIVEPFKKLNTQPFKNAYFEKNYKICFFDDNVKDAYHKLLEHHCRECGDSLGPFKNFGSLKDHLRKEHELFFCDLCIENLKIFTNERKCYTRQQLAHHRRKGDIDDTSHKGHPLCEFCDQRYMDTDELFRHLRKDHLYCHLCDADGFHQFYRSHPALRDHFRKDHYLCEEEECGEQHLTGVFRTDIDLRAHKASEHGRGLSKQAARQVRTLEVQFTLAPRLSRTQPAQHQYQPHNQHHRVEQEPVYESPREDLPVLMVPSASINTESTEQFPTLGEGGSAAGISLVPGKPAVLRQSAGALARTEQNFPGLGSSPAGGVTVQGSGPAGAASYRVNITHQPAPGPSGAVIRTHAKPNVSIQVHNRPQSSGGNRFSLTETTNKQLAMKLADKQQQLETSKKFMEEFPSLSKKDRNLLLENNYTSYQTTNTIAKKVSAPSPSQPVVAVRASTPVRAPPPPTLEAFPALHSSAAPAPPQPQWITPRPPPAVKPSKAAPAPQLPAQPALSSAADFPSLKSKSKKKTATAPAVNNQRVDETSNNNNNIVKKDKKKTKTIENPERPPESAPPDFSFKNKTNEKNYSKNMTEGNKKKNNVTLSESNDKKFANLRNGLLQDQKSKILGDSKNKSGENKISPKASPTIDSEENYPSLSIISKPPGLKVTKSKPPPGFKQPPQPPPGFSSQPSAPIPPPGFHGSIPPCNGFTFTSSSGQSYKIPAHNYVQPINFNDRNKFLVARFMEVLNDPESFNEFKKLSQLFREGACSSKSYYEHCRKSLGKAFDRVFPELLSLLPDISKQQELHKEYFTRGSGSGSLEVCETCGQVMTQDDVQYHHSFHSMQSNFPALGVGTAAAGVARLK